MCLINKYIHRTCIKTYTHIYTYTHTYINIHIYIYIYIHTYIYIYIYIAYFPVISTILVKHLTVAHVAVITAIHSSSFPAFLSYMSVSHVSPTKHVTEFVNIFSKIFLFLGNVQFENYFSFEKFCYFVDSHKLLMGIIF